MGRVKRGDMDDGVDRADLLTPLRHVETIGDDRDLRPGTQIEADDVMLAGQPCSDRAADQPRRAGDQYPHCPSLPPIVSQRIAD